MTTAEKLVKIAEKEPKVYKAGQQSMVDESKIIEKTVSGSVISLDDVSEVPHRVGVQLSSDTVTDFSGVEVKVLGESLIKSPFQDSSKTVSGITFTDNGNGTVTANGKATADVTYVFKNLSLSGTYTLNGTVGGSTSTYFMGLGSSDFADIGNGVTRTYDTAMAQNIFVRIKSGVTVNNVIFVPILEKGQSSKVVYHSSENGYVSVKSISPYMHIQADTTDVNISATYHKSFGMQTEYDSFWDSYQQNGNRTNYQHAFPGEGWTAENFKPKYDIKPTGNASNFFNQTFISGDVVDILARQNVVLDFSNVTRMGSGFYYAKSITHLGTLNFSKLDTASTYMFGTCIALHTIDKIIVTESQVYTYWFDSCTALKEIRFEGVIGKSLDIHWSTKLSYDSVANIFGHLGGTASATLTLPTSHNDGRYASLIANMPSNWAVSWL